MNSLQIQQNSFTGTAQTTEVTLKTELEQVKRDKSIATGLINTMQKDLMNKVIYIGFRILIPLINRFIIA